MSKEKAAPAKGPAKRKGPQVPVEPLIVAALFLLCGLAWWLLVVREQEASLAKAAEAAALDEETRKAAQYLAQRATDEAATKEIALAAARVAKRVPDGRTDVQVRTYLQRKAAESWFRDVKVELAGGIVLPKEAPAKPPTPEERLAVDPAALKGQQVFVEFNGTYAGVQRFQRAIASAPWFIELVSMDLRKDAKDKERGIEARMTLRYLYQESSP